MDIVFVFPLSLVMFTGRTFGFVIGFSDMNLSRFDPSSLRHDVSDMAACMESVASVMITDNLYLCTTDICQDCSGIISICVKFFLKMITCSLVCRYVHVRYKTNFRPF